MNKHILQVCDQSLSAFVLLIVARDNSIASCNVCLPFLDVWPIANRMYDSSFPWINDSTNARNFDVDWHGGVMASTLCTFFDEDESSSKLEWEEVDRAEKWDKGEDGSEDDCIIRMLLSDNERQIKAGQKDA